MTIGLAFAATFIGFATGITLGLIAAEAGGVLDTLITRMVDIMMSYPPILFALILITGAGSSNFILVLAIAIPQAARVTRGLTVHCHGHRYARICGGGQGSGGEPVVDHTAGDFS